MIFCSVIATDIRLRVECGIILFYFHEIYFHSSMKTLMVIEYLKTIIINIKLYASGYEHVNFGVYVIIHPENSCRMIDLRIDFMQYTE